MAYNTLYLAAAPSFNSTYTVSTLSFIILAAIL
jgi:hypothetical protein